MLGLHIANLINQATFLRFAQPVNEGENETDKGSRLIPAARANEASATGRSTSPASPGSYRDRLGAGHRRQGPAGLEPATRPL
jgi:hypothetical protein